MVPATWPVKLSELKLPRMIKAIHLSIVLHLVIPSILLSFLGCIHQHYCFITVLPVFCSIFFSTKDFHGFYSPQSHNTRSGMRRNNYVINDSIFNTNISFSKPRSVQLYEKRNTINQGRIIRNSFSKVCQMYVNGMKAQDLKLIQRIILTHLSHIQNLVLK